MTFTIRNILIYLVNLATGLILFFLGLRIIFRLLGANAATPFVSWIYAVSDYLITPFRGMFPPQVLQTGTALDMTAVISLVIYSILAYIATALINAAATSLYERVHHEHIGQQPHFH